MQQSVYRNAKGTCTNLRTHANQTAHSGEQLRGGVKTRLSALLFGPSFSSPAFSIAPTLARPRTSRKHILCASVLACFTDTDNSAETETRPVNGEITNGHGNKAVGRSGQRKGWSLHQNFTFPNTVPCTSAVRVWKS